MTVRLAYTSYGEIEVGDDGRARSWQTSGHRVGRFARELSASERTALERALASAARDAGTVAAPDDEDHPVWPGEPVERLTADGLPDVVLVGHATPSPGIEGLLELLRALREDIADSPVAAVELAVDGSPLAARLRHVGPEPIVVRGDVLTVQVTAFGPDSAILDGVTHTVDAHVDGPVAAGWELRLADDLGLTATPPGGFLTVTVGTLEVDSTGDGVLYPAELSWMT